ncbi:MAG: MBOAT family O-acyltransferase [Deltaproteobacteria bacterium]
MLFNSYEYIFMFLPLALILYFMFNRIFSKRIGIAWLVIASLFFYSYWNIRYLPLILVSIIVNYLTGSTLSRRAAADTPRRRSLLILGLCFNLGLLGYYKYTDFFIGNMNHLGAHFALLHIVLPLGISFFTFTQIAYLVDAYRGEVKEYSLLNYALFVTFFPHLLAGPIIHHREMMPQFAAEDNKGVNYENLCRGLLLLSLGLFKKIIIADAFAVWANYGFDTAPSLTLLEAWIASLSYTMQLYFDFSAYTDMAIGSALMFNIRLPINFNSPYKSLSIQEFWRRWHITLSRFLRDYIYIPLGGNQRGQARIYLNVLITFLLGGLWHGAAWTFVFWGVLHGLALVINRAWQRLGLKMNKVLGWFLTFNFVNIAWVFFRAKSWGDAAKVLSGMLGMQGVNLPASLSSRLAFLSTYGIEFGMFNMPVDMKLAALAVAVSIIVVLMFKNSMEMEARFRPNLFYAILAAAAALVAILNLSNITQFIYFNF